MMDLNGVTNVQFWNKRQKSQNTKFIQELVLDAFKKYDTFAKATGTIRNGIFHHYVLHLEKTTIDLMKIKQIAEEGVKKNENN